MTSITSVFVGLVYYFAKKGPRIQSFTVAHFFYLGFLSENLTFNRIAADGRRPSLSLPTTYSRH